MCFLLALPGIFVLFLNICEIHPKTLVVFKTVTEDPFQQNASDTKFPGP